MFRGVLKTARRNWPASLLVIAGVVGGLLQLIHLTLVTHMVLLAIAVCFASLALVQTWQDFRSDLYRLNALVPITIISALIAREFWVAYAVAVAYYISDTVAAVAYKRTRRDAAGRHALLPKSVSVLRGRKVVPTEVSAINTGDKFVWASGEISPFDGVIVDGETSCDLSLLSDGFNAVTKMPEDSVLSGTRNSGAPVTLKVRHTAAQSFFQTTTRLLEKGTAEHTKFARSSERYSLYFTLCAVLIGAGGWYIGHSPRRFLAVLIVATVAPLLVPTRLALAAAVSKAVRHGIIIRSGAAFQKLAEAKTFVFGFSGIITARQPVLQMVTALKPYTKNEVLGLAASLEQAIDHPLAAAVVSAAQAQGFNFIKVKHVQHIAGQGLQATLQGKDVVVGNANLLIEHGVQLPVKASAKQLTLYVAMNGSLAGTLSFQEKPRSSAANTLQQLRRSGVKLLRVISGAPSGVVEATSKDLGSIDVYGELSVAEKLAHLASSAQRPVAYVGQAVSDGSLLTAADVGVALDVDDLEATHGPIVAIIHDDIAYVATARSIVQQAFATAMQGIALGSIISLALMLLAMAGKMPLLVGVGLQLVINCVVALYPLLISSRNP